MVPIHSGKFLTTARLMAVERTAELASSALLNQIDKTRSSMQARLFRYTMELAQLLAPSVSQNSTAH